VHFWIDAVCIKQKDEAEKNEQVSMMGEVYQKAQRVVIWLGQSKGCRTQGVKVLIKRLANLGYENSLAMAGSFPGSSMSFDLTDNNVFRRYGLPKLDDEIWFHLIDFFREDGSSEPGSFRRLFLLKQPWFCVAGSNRPYCHEMGWCSVRRSSWRVICP
jgi:Heterokaryon incompatibility protein (HET)